MPAIQLMHAMSSDSPIWARLRANIQKAKCYPSLDANFLPRMHALRTTSLR